MIFFNSQASFLLGALIPEHVRNSAMINHATKLDYPFCLEDVE